MCRHHTTELACSCTIIIEPAYNYVQTLHHRVCLFWAPVYWNTLYVHTSHHRTCLLGHQYEISLLSVHAVIPQSMLVLVPRHSQNTTSIIGYVHLLIPLKSIYRFHTDYSKAIISVVIPAKLEERKSTRSSAQLVSLLTHHGNDLFFLGKTHTRMVSFPRMFKPKPHPLPQNHTPDPN